MFQQAGFGGIGGQENWTGESGRSFAQAGEYFMQRQFKQTTTLQERLAHEAELARARATSMPLGKERDAQLRKADQAETASRIDEWLSSPGLQPPK
jgi:hypothetical protein